MQPKGKNAANRSICALCTSLSEYSGSLIFNSLLFFCKHKNVWWVIMKITKEIRFTFAFFISLSLTRCRNILASRVSLFLCILPMFLCHFSPVLVDKSQKSLQKKTVECGKYLKLSSCIQNPDNDIWNFTCANATACNIKMRSFVRIFSRIGLTAFRNKLPE